MKGMITGLTLDDSVNDLARKFNIALEVCPLSSILLSLPPILSSSIPMNQVMEINSEVGWILDGGGERYDTDDRLLHFKLDISLMR